MQGEYLYLWWDGAPPYDVIRGHVSLDEAILLLEQEGILAIGYPWSHSHDYARFVPRQGREYDMEFVRAGGPGPGAFPITIMEEVPS